MLSGVVINRRPNLDRRQYDVLWAVLHNAARSGLAAQNRTGHPSYTEHLAGRVSWAAALNPRRGQRLAGLLAEVTASTPPPPG